MLKKNSTKTQFQIQKTLIKEKKEKKNFSKEFLHAKSPTEK